MNSSQMEAKIKVKSDKYISDLETRHLEFKTMITKFLVSSPQRLLLLETSNPNVCACRLYNVLKELLCQSGDRNLKYYLGTQNQTILGWQDLSEILSLSDVTFESKNLLVCQFAQHFQLKDDDGTLINTILARLNFNIKKKAIFITSRKDLFKEHLKIFKSESCAYLNEEQNKIMPVFEADEDTLIERTSFGDVSAVEEILKSGVDVDKRVGIFKQTALHYAAENGKKDVVLTLLRNGANHLFNTSSDTPFHLAAEKGHKDIVEVILENVVDVVHFKNGNERTALHLAVLGGHEHIVSTLLRNGADHLPDKDMNTPLHLAARNGNKKVVSVLLEHGANVNIQGWKNRTALHEAALNGHKDVVVTLLRSKANHLPDGSKNTPLHLAARLGHKEVVSVLLEHGADVNIQGWKKRTALHEAAINGHKDIVLTLLRNKANLLPDYEKNTPLHWAAVLGHNDIVSVLLKHGADVNIQGCNEMTALHYAAMTGHKDVVSVLLKHGANFDIIAKDGKTALHYATQNDRQDVVLIIKQWTESLASS